MGKKSGKIREVFEIPGKIRKTWVGSPGTLWNRVPGDIRRTGDVKRM